MRKSFVALVVAAALFMSGCSKRSVPTSPSDPGGGGNGQPVPGQQFEPIPPDGLVKPAVAEDGTIIQRMRAVLIGEPRPPRGSLVVLGPRNCLDVQCFQMSMRFEFDGIDNPNVGMRYELYWSIDGVVPMGPAMQGSSMAPGVSGPWIYGPWVFLTDSPPKYLLIKLRHSAGGTGDSRFKDPAEEGWVNFLFGYR